MSVEEALIGVGLVCGLVPFGYTVRKDGRESRERDEARVEEERRRRKREIGGHYVTLVGRATALLDAFIVDGDNADDLQVQRSVSLLYL